MKFINSLLLHYFKPKSFELYRGKPIYEFIGIKLYKKYLPSTGDIMRRWRNIKQIDIGCKNRIDELYRYERKTRYYEWRHIIGAIILIVLTFFIDRKLTTFDLIFLAMLNLFVNIYPIFLQRYNRMRILLTIEKSGNKNPYQTTIV